MKRRRPGGAGPAELRRRHRGPADRRAGRRPGARPRQGRARRCSPPRWQAGHPLVLDGDALHLLDAGRISRPARSSRRTAGEFVALFGAGDGVEARPHPRRRRARGAVVVHKGADTVIAAPDGRVAHRPAGNPGCRPQAPATCCAVRSRAMRAAGLRAVRRRLRRRVAARPRARRCSGRRSSPTTSRTR